MWRRPGHGTVARPPFDDAGVVFRDVGADGEDLRTVLLASRFFFARGDVPAVGEVGYMRRLHRRWQAEEFAGGAKCACGGGLLFGGGLDLKDPVCLPGGDECSAELLVGIAAFYQGGQAEGLQCCHTSVVPGSPEPSDRPTDRIFAGNYGNLYRGHRRPSDRTYVAGAGSGGPILSRPPAVAGQSRGRQRVDPDASHRASPRAGRAHSTERKAQKTASPTRSPGSPVPCRSSTST